MLTWISVELGMNKFELAYFPYVPICLRSSFDVKDWAMVGMVEGG